MIIYSQRDGRWSGKELGWGPPAGAIGPYGCLLTDFAMIANDSGHPCDPASLDDIFIQKQVFIKEPGTQDFDLLADNALDVAFGDYLTNHVTGYDAAGIARAVNSPDTYAILWISTPSVPTHFVIAWSANGQYIADPWTGKVGTLAGYGGPAAIHKTTYVRHVANPAPAPPAPTPTPTPPPAPFWFVEDDSDVVVLPPQSDLATAKVKADELAKANPGHVYDVEDDAEKSVYQSKVPGYSLHDSNGNASKMTDDLNAAKSAADKSSNTNWGITYTVVDDQGGIVYKALVPDPEWHANTKLNAQKFTLRRSINLVNFNGALIAQYDGSTLEVYAETTSNGVEYWMTQTAYANRIAAGYAKHDVADAAQPPAPPVDPWTGKKVATDPNELKPAEPLWKVILRAFGLIS